jgi:2-oxoglutarate ferredoxin oxidoreductase subunit alpha
VLLPGSVGECFEFAQAAFDLAERLQMPVFVLSDLDLGMNNWMSDGFAYPEKPWDRGKVLDDAALAKVAKFERYRDVDGDGIPYRTLPGTKDWKGTYFTRGSGHDEAARYTEDPNAYVRNMDRLKRKLETARTLVPVPEVSATNGASVGLIAYGSSHWAVIEARAELAAQGLATSYMRVRGLPLSASVGEFVRQHERIYVIEQNRDGQLSERIRLESPERATRIRSVLHYDGLPLDARAVTVGVLAHEGVAQGVAK